MKQEPLGRTCSCPGARSPAAIDPGIWEGSAGGHRIHCVAMTVARPPVVPQAEWDTALASLAEREAAVAAAMHELGAARKRMPMVRVDDDYRFDGPEGSLSLLELFDGRNQPTRYRFYFEEGVQGWPDAGCVGCSSIADGIPQLGLLHSRDITFAMVWLAPQENLRGYAERMGGPTSPGTRSAPSASPPTSVSTSGSASTSSFATVMTPIAPTFFRTDGWFSRSAASGRCSTSRPTVGSPTTRTRPRAGRRRRIHSGFVVTEFDEPPPSADAGESRPRDAGRSQPKRQPAAPFTGH